MAHLAQFQRYVPQAQTATGGTYDRGCLDELRGLGIELQPDRDRLRFRPRSAVSPELVDRMKTHKGELLKILRTEANDDDHGRDDSGRDGRDHDNGHGHGLQDDRYVDWIEVPGDDRSSSLVHPNHVADHIVDLLDPCPKCGGIKVWQDVAGGYVVTPRGSTIAAIFERLLNPNHPEHAQAIGRAEAFVAAERARKLSTLARPALCPSGMGHLRAIPRLPQYRLRNRGLCFGNMNHGPTRECHMKWPRRRSCRKRERNRFGTNSPWPCSP